MAKKKPAGPQEPRDFFGNIIAPGDTIAALVFLNGFSTLARRKVVSIDEEGALVCTNMDGKPVSRVKRPCRSFLNTSEQMARLKSLED